MTAMNADPAVIARRSKGRSAWSTERSAAQSVLLKALNADPEFQKKRNARPRSFALPEHTTPVVRGLFIEMRGQLATLGDVSTRSGVHYDTLRSWRNCMPHVDLLEAALNTLDLELAIVPIGTRDRNGFARKKTRNATTGAER